MHGMANSLLVARGRPRKIVQARCRHAMSRKTRTTSMPGMPSDLYFPFLMAKQGRCAHLKARERGVAVALAVRHGGWQHAEQYQHAASMSYASAESDGDDAVMCKRRAQ